MSILTQTGRAAIAASIKEQTIHLAWGTGDESWESHHKVENFFTLDGKIKLDHQPVKDVRVFTGQTVYQSSIDYIVDRGVIQRTENSSINPSYGLADKGRHRNRGLFRLHGVGNQNRKNMN